MNEQDLRVRKTKQAINQAFIHLIKEKPIRKITVKELAAEANINKATFYLHYHDISDLHDEIMKNFFDDIMNSIDYFDLFISNPEEFINRFAKTASSRFDDFRFLIQGNHVTSYQQELVDKMAEKIMATSHLPDTKENEVQLDAALNVLLYLLPKYAETARTEAKQTVIRIINTLWMESD